MSNLRRPALLRLVDHGMVEGLRGRRGNKECLGIQKLEVYLGKEDKIRTYEAREDVFARWGQVVVVIDESLMISHGGDSL